MQLKRDTDYAIRILLIIAESTLNKNEPKEMDLKAICERADVPGQVALRLCNLLSETSFIKKADEDRGYISERDLSGKTVFDIIEAVEGRCNLLAVFDRRTELYARYGHALEAMNDDLSSELKKMTIRTILDSENAKRLSDE